LRILKRKVTEFNQKKWEFVLNFLNGKSPGDCRKKWFQMVDDSECIEEWNPINVKSIMEKVEEEDVKSELSRTDFFIEPNSGETQWKLPPLSFSTIKTEPATSLVLERLPLQNVQDISSYKSSVERRRKSSLEKIAKNLV
jgi:hypothetical protein